MSELTSMTATAVRALLKKREVTPLELVDAAFDRIEAVDGPVNALPTLCPERAREHAAKVDVDGTMLGGIPTAIKDLTEVAGVRSTYGSPLFANLVPERSDILVERLEERGAIVTSKSNTPEFGAGANTFNEVFGKTRNPWNTDKTCAGSSGGSAVALATGMTWLASGSDLGGSLRTPASFCNVVGMRSSPGTVARKSLSNPYDTMSVDGPMARTVEDIALLLDAMTGVHIEDPISRPEPSVSYFDQVQNSAPPKRVAWSPDLGFLPVDQEVRDICEAALVHFRDMGAEVEADCPDFSGTRDIFQALRAEIFVTSHATKLRDHRDQLKPDVIWNIEKGMAMNLDDLGQAHRDRAQLVSDTAAFFGGYDLLVCPTALVPPFDVDIRYIDEVNGHKFDNYIDWLGIAYAITCTSCPSISVPCGFTKSGLPVGLQIVARPRGDGQLLGFAHHFQKATGISTDPIDPKSPQ